MADIRRARKGKDGQDKGKISPLKLEDNIKLSIIVELVVMRYALYNILVILYFPAHCSLYWLAYCLSNCLILFQSYYMFLILSL